MDRFQVAMYKARALQNLINRRRRYKLQDKELGYRRTRQQQEAEKYEYEQGLRPLRERVMESQVKSGEFQTGRQEVTAEQADEDRLREIARQEGIDAREAEKYGYQQDQYLANVGLTNARTKEIERRMAGEGPPTTAEYNAYDRRYRDQGDATGGLKPGAPSFDEWLLRIRHPRETVKRKKDFAGSLYPFNPPSKNKGKGKKKPVPGLYD